MKTYKIHVDYETGDSNGHSSTSTELEMEWEDLDKAKAALKRIREHWLWYDAEEKHGGWRAKYRQTPVPERPEWHKALGDDTIARNSIEVLLDNGNAVRFWAPWCGYFERLHGAKIIVGRDEDMEFSV